MYAKAHFLPGCGKASDAFLGVLSFTTVYIKRKKDAICRRNWPWGWIPNFRMVPYTYRILVCLVGGLVEPWFEGIPPRGNSVLFYCLQMLQLSEDSFSFFTYQFGVIKSLCGRAGFAIADEYDTVGKNSKMPRKKKQTDNKQSSLFLLPYESNQIQDPMPSNNTTSTIVASGRSVNCDGTWQWIGKFVNNLNIINININVNIIITHQQQYQRQHRIPSWSCHTGTEMEYNRTDLWVSTIRISIELYRIWFHHWRHDSTSIIWFEMFGRWKSIITIDTCYTSPCRYVYSRGEWW